MLLTLKCLRHKGDSLGLLSIVYIHENSTKRSYNVMLPSRFTDSRLCYDNCRGDINDRCRVGVITRVKLVDGQSLILIIAIQVTTDAATSTGDLVPFSSFVFSLR